ncbi:MAG: hypothetical protein HC918_12215 [Oscillatoriales cyanobacterium SM2_1_8]|nr:hypothetical protein [Oscillatoriales cyanobacterium SM2_1_8]
MAPPITNLNDATDGFHSDSAKCAMVEPTPVPAVPIPVLASGFCSPPLGPPKPFLPHLETGRSPAKALQGQRLTAGHLLGRRLNL